MRDGSARPGGGSGGDNIGILLGSLTDVEASVVRRSSITNLTGAPCPDELRGTVHGSFDKLSLRARNRSSESAAAA